MSNSDHSHFEGEANVETNALEQRLRAHRIGPEPTRRDEVLYQCGYAAGALAERQKCQGVVRLWRNISLAASLIACATVAYHAVSVSGTQDDTAVVQSGNDQDMSRQGGSATDPDLQATDADDWIAALTWTTVPDVHLRASSRSIDEYVPPEVSTKVLEPRSTLPNLRPTSITTLLDSGV